MKAPKLSRKWTLLSYGEAPCVADSIVSQIMKEDGYDDFDIASVGGCVCDIVKNAVKWGNGNTPELTVDMELRLYDDEIEIDVTDRGTKPFDIRIPIDEYPVNGTQDELIEYFKKNQEAGRDGVALFMHSKIMKTLKSYPVTENGKQAGTRVHMAYGKKLKE